MIIAALFTIGRALRQHECPPIEGWIKKMWYMCTMEHYSVLKRNEIVKFAETLAT